MTPARFCDWLQGYVELAGDRPTAAQWSSIKDHLKLVYTKVTPDRKTPRKHPMVPEPTYCAGPGGFDRRIC